MTPNRVNRAHWPTKENRQNLGIFLIFPAHAKNGPRWPQMGPGEFFPTNPDLADILGDTDFDSENFIQSASRSPPGQFSTALVPFLSRLSLLGVTFGGLEMQLSGPKTDFGAQGAP